jgi:hypothetical protein
MFILYFLGSTGFEIETIYIYMLIKILIYSSVLSSYAFILKYIF